MLHHNVQYWYTLLWLPLLLPIRDHRLRTTLFLLYPLFELICVMKMLHPVPPNGFQMGVYLNTPPFGRLP